MKGLVYIINGTEYLLLEPVAYYKEETMARIQKAAEAVDGIQQGAEVINGYFFSANYFRLKLLIPTDRIFEFIELAKEKP